MSELRLNVVVADLAVNSKPHPFPNKARYFVGEPSDSRCSCIIKDNGFGLISAFDYVLDVSDCAFSFSGLQTTEGLGESPVLIAEWHEVEHIFEGKDPQFFESLRFFAADSRDDCCGGT